MGIVKLQEKNFLVRVYEEMGFLGIDKTCNGVKSIIEVLTGKKKFEDLTKKEHEQIANAWDSRSFTPPSLYRRYKPVAKTGDLETYNKDVSKNVLRFFKQTVA